MSTNPYPSALSGSGALTAKSANQLRTLLQQTEGERVRIAADRAQMIRQIGELSAEVDSTETVLAELEGTADRYRLRLAGAVSLLPGETVTATLHGSQGDPSEHAGVYGGPEAPRVLSSVFEPGLKPDQEAAAQRFDAAHDALAAEEPNS
jgi:hypothetical protein